MWRRTSSRRSPSASISHPIAVRGRPRDTLRATSTPTVHGIASSCFLTGRGWPRLDVCRRVVVDTEHVDRSADQFQVTVADVVVEPERRQIGRDVGRVLAAQDRVEKDPVVQTVEATDEIGVRRVVGMRGRAPGSGSA